MRRIGAAGAIGRVGAVGAAGVAVVVIVSTWTATTGAPAGHDRAVPRPAPTGAVQRPGPSGAVEPIGAAGSVPAPRGIESSASTPATQVVAARTDPCPGNAGAKEVVVSLAAQHTWLCAGRRTYADFPVTTGRARDHDATPTGTYQVQARTRNTTLDPDHGGAVRVRYWIPFKWGMYGFHDAPWQSIPFGSPDFRTGGSQGCVHMRTGDVARLFHWVGLGTTVRVVRG